MSEKLFTIMKKTGCLDCDDPEYKNLTLSDVNLNDIPMMIEPVVCGKDYLPVFTSADDSSVVECMSDIMYESMREIEDCGLYDCRFVGLAFCLDGRVISIFYNIDQERVDDGMWIFSDCEEARDFAKTLGITYDSAYDLAVKTIKKGKPTAVFALQELSGKENVFPKDERMFRIIHETDSDTV